MSESDKTGPKAFISYSWTSPEHELWVIDLAKQLEESGVHIILDKWELREGDDKYVFMEKMVTDPDIRKVIVICDRVYAEKADSRKGGVGTETQIISREVYEKVSPTDQERKFVAVSTETDDGKPYLPTYFKGRIYIDMSDSSKYTERLEQLIRWIYDKPLHKRPDRGKPPVYITQEETPQLGTSARFRVAIDALKQHKPFALASVRDYFEVFAENLENFRVSPTPGTELDDQIVDSIEAFLPYRDEAIDLFSVLAKYHPEASLIEEVHHFFERLLPYNYCPAGRTQWNEAEFDNFRFINHELFLYAVAVLIKQSLFEAANQLLEQEYYLPAYTPHAGEAGLRSFTYFRSYLKSLEFRNQRQKLSRISLFADYINQRAKRSDIKFDDLMQADLLLYLRDELQTPAEVMWSNSWYPVTLVYAVHRHGIFEVFSRAESKKYFDRLKVVLGIDGKEKIASLIEDLKSRNKRPPSYDHWSINVEHMTNFEQLCTKP